MFKIEFVTFVCSDFVDGKCYHDKPRTLPHAGHGKIGQGYPMTIEKCKDYCFNEADYKYAGVQWWDQCFCGNNEPDSSLIRKNFDLVNVKQSLSTSNCRW